MIGLPTRIKAKKWTKLGLKTLFVGHFLIAGSLLNAEPALKAFSNQSSLAILGTSSEGGVYYPTGVSICKVINDQLLRGGIRCVAKITGGSVYNIHAVENGNLDIAITRNDLLADAFSQRNQFENEGMSNIRLLMPLYENPFTILVRLHSDIHSVEELANKRINIGSKGSGRRSFSEALFRLKKMKESDFSEITKYSNSKVQSELCKGHTDAAFQLIGYPSDFYSSLQQHCPLRVLSLRQQTIDQMLQHQPLLEKISIDYVDNKGKTVTINTVSTKAVLFSSVNVSEHVISEIYSQILNNIGKLSKYTGLLSEGIATEYGAISSIIPYHPAIESSISQGK